MEQLGRTLFPFVLFGVPVLFVLLVTTASKDLDTQLKIAGQCGAPGKDWQMNGQSLQHHDGKAFDVITIALSNGQSRTFYFDITNFFGK